MYILSLFLYDYAYLLNDSNTNGNSGAQTSFLYPVHPLKSPILMKLVYFEEDRRGKGR